MSETDEWVPDGVDVTVPNAARVYDYALGGVHNFAVDREFWDNAVAVYPDAALAARVNRAFLGRAVRRLAEAGVRQFLDIGSGIPTLGNVHEVAQAVDPASRVVYVDIDPIAVEQSRSLLAGNPNARAIHGDLRDPDGILYHPQVLEFLDFSRPVAVLTLAVLHFIPDADNPSGLVARIGAALVRGSYLVLSHGSRQSTEPDPDGLEKARKLYERTPTPVVFRSRTELAALLGDTFILEPPGVVTATEWHPDPDAENEPLMPTALVAVARKP